MKVHTVVVRSAKTKCSSKRSRQIRDPKAMQQQILDAAEEEFCKHGLNGAQIEAIATQRVGRLFLPLTISH
ncbi:hypothetical protein [Chlorogloeopsis sp. ULAP02]|uniref:hypothetical protein n=1 Tax=Chlorogloeopsis sp. ULAP02 TaxID=3107926 RepID=UPI003136F446